MKRAIILLAMLAAAGLAGAQMFAQLFGGETWTPASLNPIAWYKGENDATDSAGAYDGTWSGAAAYSTGIVGLAINLAGTKQIDTELYLPAGAVTLCAWAKMTTYKNYNKLVGAGYLAKATGFGIYGDATKWYAQNRIVDNIVAPDVEHNGTTNWVHIVGMRTGAAVVIYTNGVFAAQRTTAMAAESSHPMHIGGVVVGNYMTGLIDDVLIFDRALSPTEVKKLYDETVKRNGRAW